jgi:hypothetical protein
MLACFVKRGVGKGDKVTASQVFLGGLHLNALIRKGVLLGPQSLIQLCSRMGQGIRGENCPSEAGPVLSALASNKQAC